MENKIKDIFKFLEANRKYNHFVQAGFYNNCITPYGNASDKANSLLYQILNTQSQPNLEKVSLFWQLVHKDKKTLTSFFAFSKAMGADLTARTHYESLFKALKKQPGWGDKTAALFIKAVYHVHRGNYKKYAFWKDVPDLNKSDKLYLPVDAVISHLFKVFSKGNTRSFTAINKELQNYYPCKKMEVWDDLWFWGFITQKSKNGERNTSAFNEAKYWAVLYSDKKPSSIVAIKMKANQFNKTISSK